MNEKEKNPCNKHKTKFYGKEGVEKIKSGQGQILEDKMWLFMLSCTCFIE